MFKLVGFQYETALDIRMGYYNIRIYTKKIGHDANSYFIWEIQIQLYSYGNVGFG